MHLDKKKLIKFIETIPPSVMLNQNTSQTKSGSNMYFRVALWIVMSRLFKWTLRIDSHVNRFGWYSVDPCIQTQEVWLHFLRRYYTSRGHTSGDKTSADSWLVKHTGTDSCLKLELCLQAQKLSATEKKCLPQFFVVVVFFLLVLYLVFFFAVFASFFLFTGFLNSIYLFFIAIISNRYIAWSYISSLRSM